MFQSFSGSSRRPRQVNLSGQNVNPFAASGWTPAVSGTQKTIAAAQAERQQRHQERLRLNSAKRIQRTWRGHKIRRELSEGRRQTWDAMDNDRSSYSSQPIYLVEKLRLLLTFFDYQNPEDISRLSRFSGSLLKTSQDKCLGEELRPRLLKLSQIILTALASPKDNTNENMLRLVAVIVEFDSQITAKIAWRYYEILSSLLTNTSIATNYRSLLFTALKSPFKGFSYSEESQEELEIIVYNAFALNFLTIANLSEVLGSLEEVSIFVNTKVLSQALTSSSSSTSLLTLPPESRLWLLSQFIALYRCREGTNQEPVYLRALSVMLSASANEIVRRIDAVDQEGHSEDDDESLAPLLPKFVREEIETLVNKQSITGLLAKFEIDYFEDRTTTVEGDESLLASYVLILLRIFPQLGEEIRMWLYQGSTFVSASNAHLPALKLFWQAMNTTKTFHDICTDSKAALSILLPRARREISTVAPQEGIVRDRDWRAILLFLELYAFVLRFTDDEEFLSGGTPDLSEPHRILSRSRESALPLKDVRLLTNFLKNLSFTMYFNAAELTDDESVSNESGLGNYLGNSSLGKSLEVASSPTVVENGTKRTWEDRPFPGIPGMTFNYVRSIVTRVMRMLYERDSRRRFLPNDHWLMTSRFDMEGFIPDVVVEEERRHQVTEAGEEMNDENDWVFPALSRGHNMIGMNRSRRLLHSESLRRQQCKAARKKKLAAIGPRLEILQNMPFVIPFATRVQIFRQFVYQDQLRRRGGNVDPDHWRMSVVHAQGATSNTRDLLSRHHAKISRNQIFEDAFEQFYRLGDGLKEPIQITFVDRFGATEAGIDGGGVTKEFLTSITNEAFRSEGGLNLFVTNDQNLLYPNPSALDEKKELLQINGVEESSSEWRETTFNLLRRYEFLGRIIGKCLYEGILVDIAFAGFFLLKWSSTDAAGSSLQDSRHLANINDLRDLDESLYQGLLRLKNFPGNVGDFALDFTISDSISMPGEPTRIITRNLLPNGPNTPVTNENRVLYISGVARHRLHVQPYQQTRAFLRGLGEIINPSWLSMFNQTELQTLIGGDSSEIDVDDLRHNTLYSGVYEIGDDGIEHPTIQIFWQVMKTLDDSDRRKVLKYVTSTPRAPLLGFAQLNPRFSIRDAGSDQQRLPSTSTCINLLKLPRYQSATTLQHKLLYAVNSGAGFDLS